MQEAQDNTNPKKAKDAYERWWRLPQSLVGLYSHTGALPLNDLNQSPNSTLYHIKHQAHKVSPWYKLVQHMIHTCVLSRSWHSSDLLLTFFDLASADDFTSWWSNPERCPLYSILTTTVVRITLKITMPCHWWPWACDKLAWPRTLTQILRVACAHWKKLGDRMRNACGVRICRVYCICEGKLEARFSHARSCLSPPFRSRINLCGSLVTIARTLQPSEWNSRWYRLACSSIVNEDLLSNIEESPQWGKLRSLGCSRVYVWEDCEERGAKSVKNSEVDVSAMLKVEYSKIVIL